MIAEYLSTALQEGSNDGVINAIGPIAKAIGMIKISEKTCLQGTDIAWGHTSKPFAFLGTSIVYGTGALNTMKIVDYHGDGNYAAKLCAGLVLNGHDDWYLPSLAELNSLYDNRFAIGGFDADTNNGTPHSYWSATESDLASAWFKFFNFRYQTTGTKYDSYRHNVRAIRSLCNFPDEKFNVRLCA